jgi:hypothetical protein
MSKAIKSIAESSDQLNRKVREIVKNTELNANDVMRNEGKLLVEELVDRTKPKSLAKLKKRVDATYRRVFTEQVTGAAGISAEMQQTLYKAQTSRRFKVDPRIGLLKAALQSAIKKAQDHCGFFAAGWLGVGNPLGAKRGIPAYVTKQKVQGKVEVQKKGDGVKIGGQNLVAFIRHFPLLVNAEKRLLSAAMATRITKINLNLKRIMSGKAKYRIPTK